jgi:SpoVK/Ycf46/Vps4 family AAA+-type ATPase
MHASAAGKTTLAKLTAKLMHDLGLLPTDRVVIKSGPELVGQYVGHSAQNVAEAFDAAKGGVLFIDEADTLATGGTFCQIALQCLMEHISSPTHQVRALISQQPILRILHALTNAIASIRTRR